MEETKGPEKTNMLTETRGNTISTYQRHSQDDHYMQLLSFIFTNLFGSICMKNILLFTSNKISSFSQIGDKTKQSIEEVEF